MTQTEDIDTLVSKPRGRPFAKGNPGKPVGARNRSSLALERMLEGQAEAIVEKVIELALGGDSRALRICMDRLLGRRQGRTVQFAPPQIKSAADVPAALAGLVGAVANGQLTPAEANEVAHIISATMKAYGQTEIEGRIQALENLHLKGDNA